MRQNTLATTFERGILASCLAVALTTLSPVSQATVVSFQTAPGALANGEPVSASATFTTAMDTITVVLNNLQTNFHDAGQLLSDIFFRASNGSTALTTGTGVISGSAAGVTVASNAVNGATSAGAVVPKWGLTNSSGTYHLDGLLGSGGGGTGPSLEIIGPTGTGNLPGTYSNINASIAGNGPHNPLSFKSATFILPTTGATASTNISNVVFSFSTDTGVNVAAIPIPAAVWLFGAGLLGLIGIARRK